MLATLTPAEVVGRLRREHERALADGSPVALAFDADGTLWSGDVGIDLFEAALAEGALRPAALAALQAEAAHLGVDAPGGSTEVARALYAEYAAGRYHEPRAFAMMAWAFAGYTTAELASFVDAVLGRAAIRSRLQAAVLPVLEWAAGAGVPAHVVSASPYAAVVAGAAHLGIDAARVLAMTPAMDGAALAPRLGGPVVYAEGKLEALRSLADRPILLGAFGDSAYDAPMLRAARLPVAVDPKPSLLAVAAEIPGLVELCP